MKGDKSNCTLNPNRSTHVFRNRSYKVLSTLSPTLHISKERYSPEKYGTQLVDECRDALSVVLPFTDAEKAFLDLLLEEGEIDATLLTSDLTLQKRIRIQPHLQWKALNVRNHKGLS